MEEILRVENLEFSYDGDRKALDNINLKIYRGEKIAVVGTNGAGKSTFFLNLNGVYKHTSGNIFYKNNKITKKNINDLRKHVGIVFQDADNQIIASTVKSEISFGPMNLKLPIDQVEKRVYDAMDYMNILDFKDRPPHYLSGGEKKRVSIADVIAMKPEVIVFDEPTASLDPVNVSILKDVLEKMSKENKTIVISTHDVDFAYEWADRIIVFSQGRVIKDGTKDQVFGDEDIVRQANLKVPMLMNVWKLLIDKNIVDTRDKGNCPHDFIELKKLLSKERD